MNIRALSVLLLAFVAVACRPATPEITQQLPVLPVAEVRTASVSPTPPPAGGSCLYDDLKTGKRYIGKSVERCAVINVACNASEVSFYDDCGCGCQEVSE